ncbi:MAG: hypothetical protein U1E50_11590 [Caulobacteraceae bacterium]
MSFRRPSSLALALAACMLIAGPLAACKPKPTQASEEAKIDATIADPATGSPTLREIKAQFPAEYAAWRTEMAAKSLQGFTADGLKLAMINWRQSFFTQHMPDVPKAPDADLYGFLTALNTALKAQKDTGFDCEMVFNGATMSTQPNEAARAAMEPLNAALVRAMRAGKDHPTEREHANRDDVKALEQAMKDAGAERGDVESVLRSGLNTIAMDRRCEVARYLYSAMAEQPKDRAARLLAEMMGG